MQKEEKERLHRDFLKGLEKHGVWIQTSNLIQVTDDNPGLFLVSKKWNKLYKCVIKFNYLLNYYYIFFQVRNFEPDWPKITESLEANEE